MNGGLLAAITGANAVVSMNCESSPLVTFAYIFGFLIIGLALLFDD